MSFLSDVQCLHQVCRNFKVTNIQQQKTERSEVSFYSLDNPPEPDPETKVIEK